MDNSQVEFSIHPRTKHYKVELTLDKATSSIRFFTKDKFAILRGFLLHPDQGNFWPWGLDFTMTLHRPHLNDFVVNLQNAYLDFGPDLRNWRVLDDTTGLIFFCSALT